jgi:hypothetical protein
LFAARLVARREDEEVKSGSRLSGSTPSPIRRFACGGRVRRGDLRASYRRAKREDDSALWQRMQTHSGRLAGTKRVHQVEKSRVRPFPIRISEQGDLQGVDALRGPLRILRFPPLSRLVKRGSRVARLWITNVALLSGAELNAEIECEKELTEWVPHEES